MTWRKTLACLLPLALAGCGAWPAKPLGQGVGASALRARGHEVAPAGLYPVPVGAQWAYRLSQVQGEAPPREARMQVAIAEAQPRQDGGVEARLDRRFGATRAPSTRVSQGPEGVRLARWVEADPMASLSVLVAPLHPGQAWAGRPFQGGNREVVVAGGWATVEVPAGRFQAREVRHELHYADGVVEALEYWYAPGVGMVKMIERARWVAGGQEIKLRSEGLLVGASGLAVGTVGLAPEPWQPGPPALPGQVGGAEALAGLGWRALRP